jgi:catechol 2,3-dioxygenase
VDLEDKVDVELQAAARPAPAHCAASDFATWGPVHLDVTDERRSLEFWSSIVGLQVLGRAETAIRLGVDDAELVVLHPGASAPAARGHSGLYHLAIHLPSEAEFARALGRLLTRRFPNAPTDHIMHWATYLDDPDGIGLELSFETLDRFGGYVDGGGRPMVLDADGRVRGGVEPLDLNEVFSHLGDRNLERPLPAGTRIGHNHLHVAAIEPALDFYEAIGFSRNVNLWGIGMADLHAGGNFPHRLAVNVWQGAGAPQPPPGTAGLRHLVLQFRSESDATAAADRVGATGSTPSASGEDATALMVHDPAGNRTLLTSIDHGGGL